MTNNSAAHSRFPKAIPFPRIERPHRPELWRTGQGAQGKRPAEPPDLRRPGRIELQDIRRRLGRPTTATAAAMDSSCQSPTASSRQNRPFLAPAACPAGRSIRRAPSANCSTWAPPSGRPS